MASTSDIMWDLFTGTGSIDMYLRYKRYNRQKENVKCQKTQSKQTQ